METAYILYSPRNSGWLTRSSQYHSSWREARQLSRTEAFDLCRRHKDERGLGLIPVSLDDMEVL